MPALISEALRVHGTPLESFAQLLEQGLVLLLDQFTFDTVIGDGPALSAAAVLVDVLVLAIAVALKYGAANDYSLFRRLVVLLDDDFA